MGSVSEFVRWHACTLLASDGECQSHVLTLGKETGRWGSSVSHECFRFSIPVRRCEEVLFSLRSVREFVRWHACALLANDGECQSHVLTLRKDTGRWGRIQTVGDMNEGVVNTACRPEGW